MWQLKLQDIYFIFVDVEIFIMFYNVMFYNVSVPLSQSLESIDKAGNTEVTREDLLRGSNQKPALEQEARNVLMPCDNGQSYSVSQNKNNAPTRSNPWHT